MPRTVLISLLAIVLVAGASACGDNDAADTPTAGIPSATPAASSPRPNIDPTPDGFAGVEIIDLIAHAIRKDGPRGLAGLVELTPVACAPEGEGIGGPPVCAVGEPVGTEVPVIFASACEGYYARAAALPFERVELDEDPLHGAYRIGEASQIRRPWPDAEYAVVLNRFSPPDRRAVFALLASGDGIVGFAEGCGETPEQWVANQMLTDAIVQPE